MTARVQPTQKTSIIMPRQYLGRLDQLVANGRYLNRSDAVRIAVRDLLLAETPMTRDQIDQTPEIVVYQPNRNNQPKHRRNLGGWGISCPDCEHKFSPTANSLGAVPNENGDLQRYYRCSECGYIWKQ